MGLLCQLFERFFASSGTACYPSCLNGDPCAFYRGARRSDGLFWVLFLAVEKKYLACGARTAMPNEFTTVNIAQLERTHSQKLNRYRGMKKFRSYKKILRSVKAQQQTARVTKCFQQPFSLQAAPQHTNKSLNQ